MAPDAARCVFNGSGSGPTVFIVGVLRVLEKISVVRLVRFSGAPVVILAPSYLKKKI